MRGEPSGVNVNHEYNPSPPAAVLSFRPSNLPSRARNKNTQDVSDKRSFADALYWFSLLLPGHPAEGENKTNLLLQTSARMSLTLDIIQTGKQNKALQLPPCI